MERKGQDKAKQNLINMTKNMSFNQHDIKLYLYRMILSIIKNNLMRKSLLWASFKNFLIKNHTDIL